MRREPCILVQWIERVECKSGVLIENLRYAGLLSVVKETSTEAGQVYMLQLRAPHGVDKRAWADQNAARMKSFGLNAEPSWFELR